MSNWHQNRVNHFCLKFTRISLYISYVFTINAIAHFSLPLAKSMRNQTFSRIDVKLASKRVKAKKNKVNRHFILHFICFYNQCNSTFLILLATRWLVLTFSIIIMNLNICKKFKPWTPYFQRLQIMLIYFQRLQIKWIYFQRLQIKLIYL